MIRVYGPMITKQVWIDNSYNNSDDKKDNNNPKEPVIRSYGDKISGSVILHNLPIFL
jgi:hypothetical protein